MLWHSGAMARVLIISSLVADGAVGGGLSQFVLQRLGHEVVLLPTILLSNSPDQAIKAGESVAVELLGRMTAAYEAAGRLAFDAVFIAYLPSPAHVAFAVQTVGSLRASNPQLTVCVDPVMGDEPEGLYIAQTSACAIRDDLVPLADVLTPNRFELGWLTAMNRATMDRATIKQAAAKLAVATVLVTSAVADKGTITSLLIEKAGSECIETARLAQAPHGTGDLTAALFLAARLNGMASRDAFARTIASVASVVALSQQHAALQLVATQQYWANERGDNDGGQDNDRKCNGDGGQDDGRSDDDEGKG